MEEENKIQDAEIEADMAQGGKAESRNRNRDFYIELALFLVLGILAGFAVKTEAVKKITIGFDDYKLKAAAEHYNINNLSERLKEKNTEENNITNN